VTEIRIGTCSWADEALSKHWYPKGLPAGERLAHYAQHFDTVEVDSTYYRLPDEAMVERWATRTPDYFVMHVKAFGLMTRHPVKLESLPPDLRDETQTDERGRVDRPSREFRGEVFRRFLDALEPLRSAGRLGGILFQFPSYVVYKDRSLEYLQWAREQLGDDEMLVEFRHVSWLDDEHRDETLRFLEELGATNVIVDAPRIEGAKNVAPTVLALTSPTAYVRFHGRNAETWNKRGGSASERFDYLYSEEELEEWVAPLRELAGQAEQAYAFFNNNATSPDGHGGRMAQAAANAKQLQRLLQAANVPVSGTPSLRAATGSRNGAWRGGRRRRDRSTRTGPCWCSAVRCMRTRRGTIRGCARRTSSCSGCSTCTSPCSASASVRNCSPRPRMHTSARRRSRRSAGTASS